MALNDWADEVIGGTPLNAARLNLRDTNIDYALRQLAREPDLLFVGTVTRDGNNCATSANVVWPDGATGVYSATTVSGSFPGAVDAYTITKVGSPTVTYTQPAVTRNGSGYITNRPAIVVS